MENRHVPFSVIDEGRSRVSFHVANELLEKLLRMRSQVLFVSSPDVLLNFWPVLAVHKQGLKKTLMLAISPFAYAHLAFKVDTLGDFVGRLFLDFSLKGLF